jgi:chemotaxis signal transduction protein
MTLLTSAWIIRLGEYFLALDPKYLKEVKTPGPLTPVPLVPPPLLGLINNHGTVVPIFDLAAVLGISAFTGVAMILETQGSFLGFMVEEVVELKTNLTATLFSESDQPFSHQKLRLNMQYDAQVLNVDQLLEHLR